MTMPNFNYRGLALSRAGRIGVLAAVAAGFVLSAFLLPPIAQPIAYHEFADARAFLGIPNFLDVLTNLPFLYVGVAGLAFLLRDPRAKPAFHDPAEKWPYALLFLGVAMVSAGSAFYHLAPDNARQVWDRLPMTVGFMSFVAAMVAERVNVNAGVRLLAPLVALGAASVVWWRLSAAWGVENLLPYMAVQYGSIAIVLLIAMLFPSRYTRANDIYWVVALYAAAKVAESLDNEIYSLGAILSGHSLKHLIAAGAVYQILWMLKARSINIREATP